MSQRESLKKAYQRYERGNRSPAFVKNLHERLLRREAVVNTVVKVGPMIGFGAVLIGNNFSVDSFQQNIIDIAGLAASLGGIGIFLADPIANLGGSTRREKIKAVETYMRGHDMLAPVSERRRTKIGQYVHDHPEYYSALGIAGAVGLTLSPLILQESTWQIAGGGAAIGGATGLLLGLAFNKIHKTYDDGNRNRF